MLGSVWVVAELVASWALLKRPPVLQPFKHFGLHKLLGGVWVVAELVASWVVLSSVESPTGTVLHRMKGSRRMNWKGCGRKRSWTNVIYYTGICLECLRKTTQGRADVCFCCSSVRSLAVRFRYKKKSSWTCYVTHTHTHTHTHMSIAYVVPDSVTQRLGASDQFPAEAIDFLIAFSSVLRPTQPRMQ
jgi:hypothetical protein